jgi:hypothetical protein
MAARVTAIKIYYTDRMWVDATSNDANMQGGSGVVQTAGGPVSQDTIQETTFSVEGVVRRGAGVTKNLILKWKNKESFRVTMGPVDDCTLTAMCTFDSFNVKSQHTDGSATFSATLRVTNGSPDVV